MEFSLRDIQEAIVREPALQSEMQVVGEELGLRLYREKGCPEWDELLYACTGLGRVEAQHPEYQELCVMIRGMLLSMKAHEQALRCRPDAI